MTPWDIYDVSHLVKEAVDKLAVAYQENKEKRFIKREEHRLQAEKRGFRETSTRGRKTSSRIDG